MMPVHTLATSENFCIVWASGKSSDGICIESVKNNESNDEYTSFIQLSLVPGLIEELRNKKGSLVLKSRVTHHHIPSYHNCYKKYGGDPDKAYYNPITIDDRLRQELSDLLQYACSQKNMERLANVASDYYDILNGDFLGQDGTWEHARKWLGSPNAPSSYVELEPHQLPPKIAQPRKKPEERLLLCKASIGGVGRATLRQARTNRPCSKGKWCFERGAIINGTNYVEHRQGNHTLHLHFKCAFRERCIPYNWLSPHFEQYHILKEAGLLNWIETEQKKINGFDPEKYNIPTTLKTIEKFVQVVSDGYEWEEDEKKRWRELLHLVPIDIEPYATARVLIGLTNPKPKTPPENHESKLQTMEENLTQSAQSMAETQNDQAKNDGKS